MADDLPSPEYLQLDDPSIVSKKYYFINEVVEDALREYIWTGCTDVILRDKVMAHAPELIEQIIRKQNLHLIYPGQDDSAFNDLEHIAWCQLERVLYKFRARPHCRVCYNPDRPIDSVLYDPADDEYGIITYSELFEYLGSHRCPHCGAELSDSPRVYPAQGRFGGSETILFRGISKVFNLWSQVSRTVILAFVKKEGRDKKNSSSYRDHVVGGIKLIDSKIDRFIKEARELFKHNDDYLRCLDALVDIINNDPRPYDGLIIKLTNKSGMSRAQVNLFIKFIRLRSQEFSDSPINKESDRSERSIFKQQLFQNDDT